MTQFSHSLAYHVPLLTIHFTAFTLKSKQMFVSARQRCHTGCCSIKRTLLPWVLFFVFITFSCRRRHGKYDKFHIARTSQLASAADTTGLHPHPRAPAIWLRPGLLLKASALPACSPTACFTSLPPHQVSHCTSKTICSLMLVKTYGVNGDQQRKSRRIV